MQVKERSRNKLKDFLTMAPALQVTHLLAFTLTDIAPSLRILRLSNGPTLSFRVERYSLMRSEERLERLHDESQVRRCGRSWRREGRKNELFFFCVINEKE